MCFQGVVIVVLRESVSASDLLRAIHGQEVEATGFPLVIIFAATAVPNMVDIIIVN